MSIKKYSSLWISIRKKSEKQWMNNLATVLQDEQPDNYFVILHFFSTEIWSIQNLNKISLGLKNMNRSVQHMNYFLFSSLWRNIFKLVRTVPYRIFWITKKLQILCDCKLIALKSNYSFNRCMVFTHTRKTINSIISSFKKIKNK